MLHGTNAIARKIEWGLFKSDFIETRLGLRKKYANSNNPFIAIYMFVGIRMLDQPYMTDLIEANSMGHEPNLIDIYSASWGPTDDGRTVDGPRNATMRAIVRGVNEVGLLESLILSWREYTYHLVDELSF